MTGVTARDVLRISMPPCVSVDERPVKYCCRMLRRRRLLSAQDTDTIQLRQPTVSILPSAARGAAHPRVSSENTSGARIPIRKFTTKTIKMLLGGHVVSAEKMRRNGFRSLEEVYDTVPRRQTRGSIPRA